MKELCRAERARQKSDLLPVVVDGGVSGALVAVAVRMGDKDLQDVGGDFLQSGDDVSLDISLPGLIEDVSPLIENVSLAQMEPSILASFALHASASTLNRSSSFDLSKAPLSFAEAHARSDASLWKAAMDREKDSLEEMGAFEEADLPLGEQAIGLKWVYAFKTDADGRNIPGKC